MPFSRPTLQQIRDRIVTDIEQRLTGNVPILAVSFLRILAYVFAGAIHILYGWLSWLADQLFYDTAEESSLDDHASRWGLARKAATFAVGVIDITGVDGTEIAEETQFSSDDGVVVEATESGTISGGTLSLNVRAVEAGSSGNLSDGTELEMVVPLVGVTTIEVDSSGLSGGQDQESDFKLRSRIRERIISPPAGGTVADFKRWAKEVSGVAEAWPYGNTPSAGWVTLVIKASGSNPVPTSPLLTEVDDYVSERMMITTNLSVQAIDDVDIDLTISLTIVSGADSSSIEDVVVNQLVDYLDDTGSPGGDVLISGLRNAISTVAGVSDYEITAISKDGVPQSIADISLSGYEYPVLDTITFV